MGLPEKRERLLPDGVPRYAWIYDDGGVTAERYTAVFTGLLSLKKPGEYPYLSMSGDPLALGGGSPHRGRPPYERMGYEISFEDLPEDCRQLVLSAYRDLWGLQDAEVSA